MTRPTAAQLALSRSTLPARRVASPAQAKPEFASMLRSASANQGLKRPLAKPVSVSSPASPVFHPAMNVAGGPAPISRSEILNNAQQLMNVPYVWGGTFSAGLDCSAFVSKVWEVGRMTTDTLSSVSHPISKDELQAGDALNLTVARDPDGAGHVRLFDRWANPEHTRMYVYEETPPRSLHHVINWDPTYTPMRRNNVSDA